jgi:DedD protein
MRDAIHDKDFGQVPPHHDTDLTLGPVMLLGILFALMLICALLFGLGYAIGRHGSSDTLDAMKPAPDAQSSSQAGCPQSKPSASSLADTASAQDADPDSLSPPVASSTNAAAISQSGDSAAVLGSSSGQPQVRPALPPSVNPLQSAQPEAGPGGGANMPPATAPPATVMVQIAAISHPEDADVLVNALRKRGYAVTARREPSDNLIHVRIGPFSSRAEADKWSQKLMSDGYNAIVQP